ICQPLNDAEEPSLLKVISPLKHLKSYKAQYLIFGIPMINLLFKIYSGLVHLRKHFKMTRKDIAVNHFRKGRNCAQSVLLSFSDDLELDPVTAIEIASGFGGGMGRLQKTCGALTGSFMVIGLHNSRNISDEHERKEATNRLIQELEEDFSRDFGYSDCALLTSVNLNTPEGQDKFTSESIDSRICEKCVSACTAWLSNKLK
ncbi:MAG: C-GCAxxG-C-C family protein, partial [Bacteroidales bacterium]